MEGVSIVGKRIKQARVRAGMSQQAVGVKAGIDELSAGSRISHYERGVHSPDLLTTEHIAKALGVPAPFLYAVDDTLAVWILAFGKVSPAMRKEIVRKADIEDF